MAAPGCGGQAEAAPEAPAEATFADQFEKIDQWEDTRDFDLMYLYWLLELSAGYQALAHKTWQHREAVTASIEKRKPVFDDRKS